MELYNILRNYIINTKEIHFKDKNYMYIEATYRYKENQCMKYYILDFTQYANLYEIDWNNTLIFRDFQAQLLEDDFFHCRGDERFNLYLVFIVESNSLLLDNMDIQQDFTYARKIILMEWEVENFFAESFPLERGKPESNFEMSDSKEIMRQLNLSKDAAQRAFARELECWYDICKVLNLKFEKKIKQINQVYHILYELDQKIPNQRKGKDKKKIIQGYSKNELEDCNIQSIIDINIKNFRKYKREYQIPFKMVNLLYGENGTGKTSLLEAIELGITGCNRNISDQKKRNGSIQVKCKREQKDIYIFSMNNQYYSFAKAWYGIETSKAEDFNQFFTQYNYFDTSWASAFAIEGKEQVNISQLKNFLNLENMETCKHLLYNFYTDLLNIVNDNQKLIEKNCSNEEKKSLWDRFILKKAGYTEVNREATLQKISLNNKMVKAECEKELKRLIHEIEIITLDGILSTHINSMKKIFKLLICSNEYSDLQVDNGEIVAIRSGNKEKVSMSQMSTGQKVCLALSFMFSLFLSNENAPNIIMLDEPVANLDDLHMMNLLDVLRRFAMAGTQIFFTTSNPNVAKLFRRKFSYLNEDFGFYRVSELEDKVKITYEQYSMDGEQPIVSKEL